MKFASLSLPSLFLLFAPFATLAATPQADAFSRTSAQEAAAKALEFGASPRAAAYLAELHELHSEVDDVNVMASTYFALMTRESTHPLVRDLARWLDADIERGRGHLAKSKEISDPLGFIQQFYIVGGFDNEGKSGCDVEHGPATATDPQAVYPGKNGDISWHALPTHLRNHSGFVPLSSVVRPSKDSVVYAMTFLDAPEAQNVVFWLGASGATRLYVNGQKVLSDNLYRYPQVDQMGVQVGLRKGLNRIVLKLCHENGQMGFFLRQKRPGNAPPLKVVLPSKWNAVKPASSAPTQRVPSLTELLKKEVDRAPSNAELRGDYAQVLSSLWNFDRLDHTDIKESEQAARLAPDNVRLQLLAAKLQTQDKNLRRVMLDRAMKSAPTSLKVLLAMARHEMDMGHPERALPMLEKLLKAQPSWTQARLTYAQALQVTGERTQGWQLIENAASDYTRQPALLREAARQARRFDRDEEAIKLMRASLGLRFDDVDMRESLAGLLADVGQISEAVTQYEMVLKLAPFNNDLRIKLAEFHAANGNGAQALKLFAEAKELAPDDAEVYEREGRALLTLGKRQEAMAAIHRSLEKRPQNPGLRDLQRTLEGTSALFGAAYLIDPLPLVAEADKMDSKSDAIYLIDSTYSYVQPSGQASRLYQMAVKVYTPRGVESFRQFPISYAPSRQEVQVIRARIRKPDGSVVDSYAESESSMNEPWTGMYYDARAKQLTFAALSPGDVLELQYRLDDTAEDNLLSDYWGEVDFVQGSYTKLRYQFVVDMPQERTLYWNKTKLGDKVKLAQENTGKGRTVYRFSADRVQNLSPEPSMPGWAEVATTLHVSTYKTWEDVGRYYWGLVRDQLVVTEELKQTVAQVLKNVNRKDELAVVRALYNFVVTNTRYVALEFGIHGYKPYRVDRILSRRFGDCKDKASLLHVMLKIAGIDSRLVLLRMRNLGNIGEEPASLAAFNHAIAYVPKFKLFLDGTAEFHNAQELPTADRAANILIVEPEGKSLFGTTPEATAQDNASRLELSVKLQSDGSATSEGKSRVTGVEAPNTRRAYQTAATRKQMFEKSWAQAFPGVSVTSLKISDTQQLDLPVDSQFQLEIPRFAQAVEQRLTFFPFVGRRAFVESFAPLASRQFELVLSQPFSHTFHYQYQLPKGFESDVADWNVVENSDFGQLQLSWKKQDGQWVAEGFFELRKVRISTSEYAAFRAWLLKVDEAFARTITVRASLASKTPAKP